VKLNGTGTIKKERKRKKGRKKEGRKEERKEGRKEKKAREYICKVKLAKI
jgi:hypothetical protein